MVYLLFNFFTFWVFSYIYTDMLSNDQGTLESVKKSRHESSACLWMSWTFPDVLHILTGGIKIIFELVYRLGSKQKHCSALNLISSITVRLFKRILSQSLCVHLIIMHHDITIPVQMVTPMAPITTPIEPPSYLFAT